MDVDKDKLSKLIDDLSLLDDVQPSDIPDIDLYMDQMTTFIDEKLKHLKRSDKDKILTKTMINNYTKAGILMPPKNKKYNKQHIILLIMIYYLKQILSIDDIKSLLNPIFKNMNTPEDDLIPINDIYSVFLEIKQNEFDNYCDVFTDKFKEIRTRASKLDNADQRTAELFLTVIMLVAQADAQKRLAEKIIDENFKKKS
jgi:hypothetical protein